LAARKEERGNMATRTKIQGPFRSLSERHDLAKALEHEGEHRLARAVRNELCLADADRSRAVHALEASGLQRHVDFREERCATHTYEREW
jgi:hypothetical protein